MIDPYNSRYQRRFDAESSRALNAGLGYLDPEGWAAVVELTAAAAGRCLADEVVAETEAEVERQMRLRRWETTTVNIRGRRGDPGE